jgi:hypothetical protein
MAKKRTGKKGTAKKRAGRRPNERRTSRKKTATTRGRISKTWKALKSSTARMVKGVKDTFAADES